MKMMQRDPAQRIDAATLWHTMQDVTNHGTINPADPDSPIAVDPTVVLGATVVGVDSPWALQSLHPSGVSVEPSAQSVAADPALAPSSQSSAVRSITA